MEQDVKRHHLLDILRGCASLSVVLWHYQHFSYPWPGQSGSPFDPTKQPFYGQLSLFYLHGYFAIYLFFVLSGFIFFLNYADAVHERRISGARFFVLRFSRLYPLNLATLCLVGFFQYVCFHYYGSYFVYPCNDGYHFILNLLFASQWIPESTICWSFNAPVWSVSMECLLYMVFFIFAVFMPTSRIWRIAAVSFVATVGLVVYLLDGYAPLATPLLCFFLGGLICIFWRLYNTLSTRLKIAVLTATLSILLLSIIVLVAIGPNILFLCCVTFPALVLTLACLQTINPRYGTKLTIIGEITYSVYLLHFPIQIMLVMALVKFVSPDVFRTEIAFVSFFFVLIVTSICSFRLFEVPMQDYIRSSMLKTRLRKVDYVRPAQ